MDRVRRLLCYFCLLSEFILVFVSSYSGLKMVRVNVPQFRVPGEIAVLHCEYELKDDTLYAVKWYKDDEEFYRFVPKTTPQAASYKVDGVHVDMSKSNRRRVILHSISWKTSGLYRCEVSAEAPSFDSAQSEARMEVVSLPEEDPVITGVEMQYQVGDEINLNCTSGKSYPASILHWYINDKLVQTPLIHYPTDPHEKGLLSTTLGLRFVLSNDNFLGGSMRVKCVASIAPILYQSGKESVVQTQTMPIKDMREALLLVRSSSVRPAPNVVVSLVLTSAIIIKGSISSWIAACGRS